MGYCMRGICQESAAIRLSMGSISAISIIFGVLTRVLSRSSKHASMQASLPHRSRFIGGAESHVSRSSLARSDNCARRSTLRRGPRDIRLRRTMEITSVRAHQHPVLQNIRLCDIPFCDRSKNDCTRMRAWDGPSACRRA
jgi:hypothetical protein